MPYNIKKKLVTVTIAADGTTANANSEVLNGRIVAIMADVPALVGTTTLTLTLKDSDGFTIYTKASIAEGAKFSAYVDANNVPLALPIAGVCNVTCTASNAQTGVEAPIPVTLLIDQGF